MLTILTISKMLESVEHSPAAEEIAGNEDLVRDILLRLPVKSLLRFESVSKEWRSLISDPHFSQNYTRRLNPNFEPSGLLLNNKNAGFQFVPFNDGRDHDARVRLSYPSDSNIMILHSCNGLLLCSSNNFPYRKPNFITVHNPTTKKFTTVRFPNRKFQDNVVAVSLAFDPLKSPHYKLVCVRNVNAKTPLTYRIDIYSSETRSWRPPTSRNPLIFKAPNDICFDVSVYFNGAIHWYSHEKTSLYFDTDTECLETMPMPPSQEDFAYRDIQYFGESRGHLHIIVIDEPSAMEYDILELETDYSGWFVRYHVDLYDVTATFPELTWNDDEGYDAFSALCVARAEKEEESTLVLLVSGEFIFFNLNDETSKKLCDLEHCPNVGALALHYNWSDAFQYIETLFPV